MKHLKYRGHKNWAYWNIARWLRYDAGLYYLMRDALRTSRSRDATARAILAELHAAGVTHTPDGARYSLAAIRAAMRKNR